MINNAELSFKNGFNCSQSVFSTFAPELGLDKETALKIADGFGAGMGYSAETCGAVTGAFMAIGLKYGRSKSDDDQAKEKINTLIKEFMHQFK